MLRKVVRKAMRKAARKVSVAEWLAEEEEGGPEEMWNQLKWLEVETARQGWFSSTVSTSTAVEDVLIHYDSDIQFIGMGYHEGKICNRS